MVQKKSASLFDDGLSEPGRQHDDDVPVAEGGDQGRADLPSKSIAEMYIADAVVAVKESPQCETLDVLKERLVQLLGQNSETTRTRNARWIMRWFFPDGIDGIARKTWLAYADDRILLDVLRYLYLKNEPVIGACVTDCLFPIEFGMRVPATEFDRFLTAYYGEPPTKKTSQRVKTNLIKFGIIEKSAANGHLLVPITPAKTALLLLTHCIFTPNGPRTVELRRLLADPFWKYLGFKSEDAVRVAFREADAAGILGKYVVADQLEQITTRWSLDQFLSHAPRLTSARDGV